MVAVTKDIKMYKIGLAISTDIWVFENVCLKTIADKHNDKSFSDNRHSKRDNLLTQTTFVHILV